MNSKVLRRAALCIALGSCLASMAPLAMAQSVTGAVAGRANAGEQITVTNPATGLSRTVTVGKDGTYRVAQLPPGDYTLVAGSGDAAFRQRVAGRHHHGEPGRRRRGRPGRGAGDRFAHREPRRRALHGNGDQYHPPGTGSLAGGPEAWLLSHCLRRAWSIPARRSAASASAARRWRRTPSTSTVST